ncbi:PE family protein, partial [Mycobacterium gordonae]|uniref:PE family protein n=2 Tax=Mycobacteriaceae TaxID=1762 RepID=UPI000AFB2710
MSYLIVTPDLLTTATADLADIESRIGTANAIAAAHTASIVAAAEDEVSTTVAALFGTHAREYQALGTHLSALHHRFVRTLGSAATSYAGAEAAGASPLQAVLDVINAPTQALLNRPLIGNGANAAPGSGLNGGDGGLLFGNGGAGGSGAYNQNGGK